MSKMELLCALEAEKSTKVKCKKYCGTPCIIFFSRQLHLVMNNLGQHYLTVFYKYKNSCVTATTANTIYLAVVVLNLFLIFHELNDELFFWKNGWRCVSSYKCVSCLILCGDTWCKVRCRIPEVKATTLTLLSRAWERRWMVLRN